MSKSTFIAFGVIGAFCLVILAQTPPTTLPVVPQANGKDTSRSDFQGIDFRPATVLTKPYSIKSIARALVQQDVETDQIRRISGRIKVPGTTTAVGASEAFVRFQMNLLTQNTSSTELKKVKQVESLTGTHITYQRYFQGLPVFEDLVSVEVDNSNKIESLNSEITNIPSMPITTPQDPSAAIQLAIETIRQQEPQSEPPVDLTSIPGIAVVGGKPVAVWRVTFKTRTPSRAWRITVDADANKILSVIDVSQHVEGSAMVFSPNPIVSTGDTTLKDNMGGLPHSDHPQLTDARVQVVLHNLDNSGLLQGDYASTAPTERPGLARAREPSRIYHYTRSDSRFQEVMAYHWVTECQLYIHSLGIQTINNHQVKIDAHFTSADNSFYDPNSKTLQFGDGGIADAEDAEVILHELGHAIQDDQVPGFSGSKRNTQARAIGEGFSDYWATSFFADVGPRGSAWNYFFDKWDGCTFHPPSEGNPPYLRKTDSSRTFQDWQGEEHADGEIWSACLWQIRLLVGRQHADTMILESHFGLPTNGTCTFKDAAKSILAANQILYNEAKQSSIKKIFVDRGILPPNP